MIEIRNIDTKDDLDQFNQMSSEQLHIVKFGAPWCWQCKVLSQNIKKLEDSKINGALFGSIELDEEDTEEFGETYDVISLPTTIFFKNGIEVKRVIGVITDAKLYEYINELS